MATNSVIEHRENYYFIKLHEAYVQLCRGNHCQALILSVLEEWTNTKERQNKSPYVYMTYPQWVTALYGIYGRNMIIKALFALEERGLIAKRPYQLYGKETFEYALKTDRINELLKELPEKRPEDTLPQINAWKKERVPKSTRLRKDGSDLNAVPFRTGDAFKKGRNGESPITQILANRESRVVATAPSEDLSSPTSLATAVFSLLKTLPQEEVTRLLEAFPISKRTEEAPVVSPPPALPTREREKHTLNGLPEKPAPDSRRSAETVVALIEWLRGQRYGPDEWIREKRAGTRLLTLFPDLTLAQIEEAWRHGSDDYWRRTHGDQVHVHDLINTDSRGRPRVQAFLEHKRAHRHRLPATRGPAAPRQVTSKSVEKPTLSEELARYVMDQIACDASVHGYDLRGEAQTEGTGWIVVVSWKSFAWKGDLGIEIRSLAQWQQEFANFREIIQLREASKQRREVS